MLDLLLANFRLVMVGGFLFVVGISQLNRIVGSVLGLAFVLLLAVLGTQIYARGGVVGLGFFPIGQGMFYVMCGVLAAFNGVGLWIALSERARQARFRQDAP